VQLHILGAARQVSLQVARVECRDCSTDDLQILLRNTRSPARKLRVFIRRG
jgi:hypothetical protein